jgi:hypothetical protein
VSLGIAGRTDRSAHRVRGDECPGDTHL